VCFSLDASLPKQHKKYQTGCQSFPKKTDKGQYTAADLLLEDLPLEKEGKESSSTAPTVERNNEPLRTPDWVSTTSWKLIDQWAALKQQGTQGQEIRLRDLNNDIRKNIKQDRKAHTMKARE
jgi:hypothetical protein